eukprot:g15663.t1
MDIFVWVAVLTGLLAYTRAEGPNMNNGGVPYKYSNPPEMIKKDGHKWKGTPGEYETTFTQNIVGDVEHFDVYGEVRTVYSQVYWTRNLPINLPPSLVKRFEGKVMAITGYEVDQVIHEGPEPGSTTTATELGGFSCYPSCDKNGEDKSVPIYNAYNHHYFSWLTGADAEMYESRSLGNVPNPTSTAFRAKANTTHGYPASIVYKENPGGEFRKSYHGYPSGYAQLIASPTQWVVEPMQIDTHNRNYDINDDQIGYEEWFLPKRFTGNNMTDLHSGMCPLIECPCTDRITKLKIKTPVIVATKRVCENQISSAEDCKKAFEDIIADGSGYELNKVTTLYNSDALPNGCIIDPIVSEETDGSISTAKKFNLIVNLAAKTSKAMCGNDSSKMALYGKSSLNLTTLTVEHSGYERGSNITFTISGPSDVWYGVGFNAEEMKDEPYAIIIDGKGEVSERKLGEHAPGKLLRSTLQVISNSVNNNTRTVVLTREIVDENDMPYLGVAGNLNVITAVGSTIDLSYHKSRTAASIVMIPEKVRSCLCQPNTKAFIVYMNQSKQGFGYDCVDEPRSDMLRKGDGTQRSGIQNMACDVETYHGGLQCCKHKTLLTDLSQDSKIPKDKVDKYFLKWRYYFQEYKPMTLNTKASHKHLHHWVFLIDDAVNDYEEDNLKDHYGIDMGSGIGKITAHLQVKDMGLEDNGIGMNDNPGAAPVKFNDRTTITPLVMTPHCHAPSCIREEFWNADTGEIICNMTALYGDERYGSTNSVFNEANYITIAPCIFGYQPGLQYPFTLTQDTNITAIKYFNNTWRHLGQMAQWTGLMIYDSDPY